VYVSALTNRLFVIDTATNGVVDTIPVDGTLAALATTPNGAFVYVANPTNRVAIVDPDAGSVVRTLAVGTYPAGIGFTPDGTLAYVGSGGVAADGGTISVIDAQSQVVTGTIRFPAGTPASPGSVAIADLLP
jgi:YVTN family beta-propeller protein